MAVLFWEQALALPALLALVWLCFARDSGRPAPRVVKALVPFAVVSTVFTGYVQAQPWHQKLVIPPLHEFVDLLVQMVFRGFAPTLVGTALPSTGPSPWEWTSMIVVTIGLVGGGAWLAVHHRFRWSGPMFFVVCTVLVSVPVAASRSSLAPAFSGDTPRYITFLPLIAALAVAGAAVARHRRGKWPRWLIGLWVIPLALFLVNLNMSFNDNPFGQAMGDAAAVESGHIGAGLRALGPAGQRSLIDSALEWPLWYPAHDGSGELSTLMPYWSASAEPVGEGRIAGLDGTGTVRWATFHPSTPGLQYVRVTVIALKPTTMTVRISASHPSQPETPWRLAVTPGRHTFTLPAWSDNVASVSVHHGPSLALDGVATGSVALGKPV